MRLLSYTNVEVLKALVANCLILKTFSATNCAIDQGQLTDIVAPGIWNLVCVFEMMRLLPAQSHTKATRHVVCTIFRSCDLFLFKSCLLLRNPLQRRLADSETFNQGDSRWNFNDRASSYLFYL